MSNQSNKSITYKIRRMFGGYTSHSGNQQIESGGHIELVMPDPSRGTYVTVNGKKQFQPYEETVTLCSYKNYESTSRISQELRDKALNAIIEAANTLFAKGA